MHADGYVSNDDLVFYFLRTLIVWCQGLFLQYVVCVCMCVSAADVMWTDIGHMDHCLIPPSFILLFASSSASILLSFNYLKQYTYCKRVIHQILLPWQPAFLQFEKYWGLIWWVTCWHRHECFTRCRRSKSKASSRWNCIFQEFSLIWGLLHFYSYLMLWNLVCNGNKLPPFRFIFQIVHLHSLYSSINSLFHTCICICICIYMCVLVSI